MKLAIFDFDGTLIEKDTLPCLAREWTRQRRSRGRYIAVVLATVPILFMYIIRVISRETMKGLVFKRFNRIFTNLTRQEIEEFFRQAYPYLKQVFNQEVIEQIKLAQQQGYHCVLLSGSYIELLQIVSKDLGINTVMGAKLAYKGDVYNHQGVTPFVDGKSKRQLLQDGFAGEDIQWEASRAFGDSYTDILIMEMVGEKVAVNPDKHLMSHARKNGWRVLTNR